MTNTQVDSADLLIRPVAPGDREALARIIREVMGELGAVGEGYSINDPAVDDMPQAYEGEDRAFFVVDRGGDVVGGAGVGPLEGGPADVCELQKMYLLPEARGLGVGRGLLELCLVTARELGYRRCYLETLAVMEKARELYRGFGFEPLQEPLGKTGHFSCNQFFIKDLADGT